MDSKEKETMELPSGFVHWKMAAMLVWVAYEIIKIFHVQRSMKKDVLELKSLVETFLRPQIRFYVRNVLQKEIRMKDTEKVTATIELDDAKGFPVGGTFDQPPVWTVDDETICTVAPGADGLSCDIIGQKPGNANVTVAGVAAGVSYTGTVTVPVVAGDATQVKVSLGTPVAQ